MTNEMDLTRSSDGALIKMSAQQAANFKGAASHIGVKAVRIAHESLKEVSGLIGVQLSDRQFAYYQPEDFKRVLFLNMLLSAPLEHTADGNISLNPNKDSPAAKKLNFLVTRMKGELFDKLTDLSESAFKYASNYQKLGLDVFKKDFQLLLVKILRADDFSGQAVEFLKELKQNIPGIANEVDRIIKEVISPFEEVSSNSVHYQRIVADINRIPNETWGALTLSETISGFSSGGQVGTIFQTVLGEEGKTVTAKKVTKKAVSGLGARLREIWNDFKLWLSLLFTRPSKHIFKILESTKISNSAHSTMQRVFTDFPKLRIDNANSQQALIEASKSIPNGRILVKRMLSDVSEELLELNVKEAQLVDSKIRELDKELKNLTNSSDAIFFLRAIEELKLQRKEIQNNVNEILNPIKKVLKDLIDDPNAIDLETFEPTTDSNAAIRRHAMMTSRKQDRNEFVEPLTQQGRLSNKISNKIAFLNSNLSFLALKFIASQSNVKFSDQMYAILQSVVDDIEDLKKSYNTTKGAYSKSTCEAIEGHIHAIKQSVQLIVDPMAPDGTLIVDKLLHIGINEILNSDAAKWPNSEIAQVTLEGLENYIERQKKEVGNQEIEKVIQAYNHLHSLLPEIDEISDYKFTKAYLNAQGNTLWHNFRTGEYTESIEFSTDKSSTIEITVQDGAKRLASIIRKRASTGFQDFEVTKDLAAYAVGAARQIGNSLRQLQHGVELREYCRQFAKFSRTGMALWQRWNGDNTTYLCTDKIPTGEGWKKIEPYAAMAKTALVLGSHLISKEQYSKEIALLVDSSPVMVMDKKNQVVACIDRQIYDSMPLQHRTEELPLISLSNAIEMLDKFDTECRNTDFSNENPIQLEARLKRGLAFAAILRKENEIDPQKLRKLQNTLSDNINSILQVIQDNRDAVGDQLGVLQFITELYRSITNKVPMWVKREEDKVVAYQASEKQPKGKDWAELRLLDILTLFPRLIRKWGTREKLEKNDPLAQQIWLIAAHMSPIILWDKAKNVAVMKDRTLYDSFPPLDRARIYERVSPAQSLELASEFIEECEGPEWPPSTLVNLEEFLKKGLALSVLLQKAKQEANVDQVHLSNISGSMEAIIEELSERYRTIISEGPRLTKVQKMPEAQRKETALLEELKNCSPPDEEIRIYRDSNFNNLQFASMKSAKAEGMTEMEKGRISIGELRNLSPQTPSEKIALFQHVCTIYAEIDHPSNRNNPIPYQDRLYLEQQITNLFQDVLKTLWKPQNRYERLVAYSLLDRLLQITKEFKNQWLQHREKVDSADTIFLANFLERLRNSLVGSMQMEEPQAPPPKPVAEPIPTQVSQEVFREFQDELSVFLSEVTDFSVKQMKDLETLKEFRKEHGSYSETFTKELKKRAANSHDIESLLGSIAKKLDEHLEEVSRLIPPAKPLKVVTYKTLKKSQIEEKSKIDTFDSQIRQIAQGNKYNKKFQLKSALEKLQKHVKDSKLSLNEIKALEVLISDVKKQITESELKFVGVLMSDLERVLSERKKKAQGG